MCTIPTVAGSRKGVDAKCPVGSNILVAEVCSELALFGASQPLRLAIGPVGGGEVCFMVFTVNGVGQENTAEGRHLLLRTET